MGLRFPDQDEARHRQATALEKRLSSFGELPASSDLGSIGLVNGALFGASSLVEIACLWLIADRLSAGDFDRYATSIALAMVLAWFPNSWCRIDFHRSLRRALDGAARQMSRRFGTYYVTSVGGFVIVALIVAGLTLRFSTASTFAVVAAGSGIFLLAELQGALRFSGYLRLAPLLDFSARCVLMVALLLWSPSLEWTVLLFAGSRFAVALVAVIFLPRLPIHQMSPAWPSLGDIATLVSKHSWVFLALAAEYIVFWADIFLLLWLAAGSDVGGVFVATRLIASAIALGSLVGDLLLPRLLQAATTKETNFEEVALSALAPLLTCSSCTLVLLAIGGLAAVSPSLANDVPDGTLLILCGCLPVLVALPNVVIAKAVLISRDRLKTVSRGGICAGGTKLALVAVTLHFLGVMAVPIALVLAYVLQAAYYYSKLAERVDSSRAIKLAVPMAISSGVAAVAVSSELTLARTAVLVAGGLVLHASLLRSLKIVPGRGFDQVVGAAMPRWLRLVFGGLLGFPPTGSRSQLEPLTSLDGPRRTRLDAAKHGRNERS